jgi:simple sugar transport system permease protein
MSSELFHVSLVGAVLVAVPLLYAALGELISERVGVMNIGIEGIMSVGAAAAFIAAIKTGSPALAMLTGTVVGGLFTLVFFAVPVILLRTSQILVGFAVWFIGLGASSQFGESYATQAIKTKIATLKIPLLADIPFVGEILFEQPWPFYVGVLVAVAVALLLTRTAHGLDLRGIGDDPAAAYASGVPVLRWQLLYVSLGGALMGLGGAVISVVITHHWQSGLIAGRGWIALALVIFVGWRPLGLLWATYLFGILLTLDTVGQAEDWAIPAAILAMPPYLATVAILIIRSRRGYRLAPAALGTSFLRGGR